VQSLHTLCTGTPNLQLQTPNLRSFPTTTLSDNQLVLLLFSSFMQLLGENKDKYTIASHNIVHHTLINLIAYIIPTEHVEN